LGINLVLGVLGFCYVLIILFIIVRYPVLVQVQEGEEIFQFPVCRCRFKTIRPRESLEVSAVDIGVSGCV